MYPLLGFSPVEMVIPSLIGHSCLGHILSYCKIPVLNKPCSQILHNVYKGGFRGERSKKIPMF